MQGPNMINIYFLSEYLTQGMRMQKHDQCVLYRLKAAISLKVEFVDKCTDRRTNRQYPSTHTCSTHLIPGFGEGG